MKVPGKLVPANVGGSPKQYAILGGLLLLILVMYFVNRTPSSPGPSPAPSSQARTSVAPDPAVSKMPVIARRPNRNAIGRSDEFKPTLKVPEGTDVSKIDPTIHLDLLARVRETAFQPGSRGSVFSFGQAPPPPPPKVDPIKVSKLVNPAAPAAPPPPDQAKPAGPPPAPQAPPIPLKFFGYSNQRGGVKRAFFLDGDDIDVVNENDVIKNRYKVVRIGVNSVVVEDLNFKTQQTLPLVEELAG